MPPERTAKFARRHRSATACQACRQRKVRCSLSVTGVPCAGCAQDLIECVVNPRQVKNKIPGTPLGRPRGSSHAPGPTSIQINMDHESSQISQNSPVTSESPLNREQNNIEDEERSGRELAAAVLGQSHKVGEVPFYTGELTGPTSALYICSQGQSLPRHLLIPSKIPAPLSDEDRNFLRIKGVFTLPGNDACDSLLRAYICHVHPIMPVIEIDRILNYHQDGRLNEYNMLLLWSVFFVAVNFIPAHVYEQEGYKSRKEMKAEMYSRAKSMYSISGESDKIVRLQSSLLMGFWHSELDSHTQPWFWTGTAINYCQMLGLHRDPDAFKYNASITDRQRCLWRRLWWTCFFRDRWLGLTLGRPLRINLDDCDTPMPVAADLLTDLTDVPESTSAAYIPNDMPQLAKYWIVLIELSKLLGACLSMNYKIRRSKPSIREVKALEDEILQCKLPDQYEAGLTRLARFNCYHVHLHYQALLITFYRPYITEVPDGLPSNVHGDWNHQMRLKADSAASQTNNIVDALAQDKILEFAGPMTPSLLIPAMQTHLLHCKFADPLSRRLRLNKLEMFMLIMEELSKTYSVAAIYRGIFVKAIQQIFPRYPERTPQSDQIPGTVDYENTTSSFPAQSAIANAPLFDSQEIEAVISDEYIDALMGEASLFNLWESWKDL